MFLSFLSFLSFLYRTDAACIQFPSIDIMLNIWCTCEKVLEAIIFRILPDRGMTWWYDTMILMSYHLGSDQSLHPELAKHDQLNRPQVVIGASITVCDLVYVLSTKCSRSVRNKVINMRFEDLDLMWCDLMWLLKKLNPNLKLLHDFNMKALIWFGGFIRCAMLINTSGPVRTFGTHLL